MASQSNDKQNKGSAPSNQPSTDAASTDSASVKERKSWYRRYMDAKTGRNVQVDEDELKKYTGMTKAQLEQWAQTRADVGANQAAGKLTVGHATGLGGYETAHGFGGWGSSNEKVKFPPQEAETGKRVDGDDSD